MRCFFEKRNSNNTGAGMRSDNAAQQGGVKRISSVLPESAAVLYILFQKHVTQSRMANYLHIHKNTVAYRMQKMAELFDLNLKDCRLVTALYLSLFDDYRQ